MSGLLAGKVWLSDLPHHLKNLASALADIANDDGADIYPGIDYLAWKLSSSERKVQYGMKALKDLGVIRAIGESVGGRGRKTEYRMYPEKLPTRPSWKATKNAASVAPFMKPKGAKVDTQRVQKSTSSLLLDPSSDPSVRSSSKDQVPEPGKVYNGGHIPKPKKVRKSKHDEHLFCGAFVCLDKEKLAEFEKRVRLAGGSVDDFDILGWVKDRDGELDDGSVTITDHPAFWLAKQFGEALKAEFGAAS